MLRIATRTHERAIRSMHEALQDAVFAARLRVNSRHDARSRDHVDANGLRFAYRELRFRPQPFLRTTIAIPTLAFAGPDELAAKLRAHL